MPTQQQTAARTRSNAMERAPWWAWGAGAALIFLSFARKPGAHAIARASQPKRPETDRLETDRPETRHLGTGPTPASQPAENEDRGRTATTPSEIPARGWKDVLVRTFREISEDRVVAIAAGVTFYILLAIFPAIGALVSLYGLFADPQTVSEHLRELSGLLPGGAVEIIGEQVTRVAEQGRTTLGATFLISLGISLWSANAGIKALLDALNIVYDEEEKRGFLKLTLLTLTFTAAIVGFMLFALGAMVVLPVVLDYVGLTRFAEAALKIVRWPVMFLVVAFGIACLYRYGPSRRKALWRWITWGSGIAAFLWIAASMLFAWYAENFGSYNKTYGSLGAAIGFMTWIWLSTIVILLGAELDSEMEHQTEQDTTEGPSKPLGTRGATVADTVGAATG